MDRIPMACRGRCDMWVMVSEDSDRCPYPTVIMHDDRSLCEHHYIQSLLKIEYTPALLHSYLHSLLK